MEGGSRSQILKEEEGRPTLASEPWFCVRQRLLREVQRLVLVSSMTSTLTVSAVGRSSAPPPRSVRGCSFRPSSFRELPSPPPKTWYG